MSQGGVEELLESLRNNEYNMRGCTSWSTLEGKAQEYSGSEIGNNDWKGRKQDIQVVFVAEKHTKATSIQHLSYHLEKEAEVLGSTINRYGYINSSLKIRYTAMRH